jgi:hypothetical protein
MNKKHMERLGEVLVDCTISALENNPSPGWAGIARGLLTDYRDMEGVLPEESLNQIKEKLSEDAPFKFGS